MSIYLKDSNHSTSQDSFGVHSNIAKSIIEIIKKVNLDECSFNLGLFGSWGCGKSFIINKIKENLPSDYIFLNIDIWKFVGNPLLRSILFDINKQLKNNASDMFPNGYTENHRELESLLYYEECLKNEIPLSLEECDKKIKKLFIANKPYWLTVFGIMVLLFIIGLFVPKTLYDSWGYWSDFVNGLLTTNSNLIGFCVATLCVIFYPLKKIGQVLYSGLEIQNYKTLPNFSPEQFERIFENITKTISSNNKKLIIVFDNLDRCEPKYAYETLSTIKTFMDIKNCFYIIPCDDNAVKQYISNNYSIIHDNKNTFSNTLGSEFFDKLFDTYLRIPILEEIDRDIFIEEQLKRLTLYEELKENIREIKQILYYGYKGATPRQIKKFLNDFSTYYMLAKNIDPKREYLLNNIPFFSIMIVIKQKWNAVENILIQNPKLIDNELIKYEKFPEYSEFINKIKPIIPQKQPTLLSFIYLKQAINEQYINELLRYGKKIENFDENSFKRISTEIKNIINNNENIYIINASNSCIQTFVNIKNLDKGLKTDFINLIGKIISSVNSVKDFASILNNNQNVLQEFCLILSQMPKKEKEIIKNLIIEYLKDNQNTKTEIAGQLFKIILEIEDLFKKEEIHNIFTSISGLTDVSESIQNYVKIAFEKNCSQYIPQSFINLIINSISNSTISVQAKACLDSFEANQLESEARKLLAQKTQTLR